MVSFKGQNKNNNTSTVHPNLNYIPNSSAWPTWILSLYILFWTITNESFLLLKHFVLIWHTILQAQVNSEFQQNSFQHLCRKYFLQLLWKSFAITCKNFIKNGFFPEEIITEKIPAEWEIVEILACLDLAFPNH